MTATTVNASGIPLLDVTPDGPARGGIVLVQEIYGVNDHIADVAGRLANAGYRVAAPHLFHREGVNALPYDYQVAKPHMDALNAADMRADIDTALDFLAAQGFSGGTAGVLGFCMGGSVAFVAAAEHGLGAAVTFYGGGVADGRFGYPPLLELAPHLRTPWLGLFGDLDQSIPIDDVERLRAAAASAPVPTSIVRYPQAGHAFHCDARPSNYHEPSARDAWSKALDWLGRYIGAD